MVSCIITTYKRKVEIVERALLSILKQTYKNIEILIINDYPEDNKLVDEIGKMIEKYKTQKHIEYIVLEHHCGACKARNAGIQNSKGKYIAFLDDDDEWIETKIEKQVEFAKKYNADLVYCNSITKNEENKTERIRHDTEQPSGLIFNELLIKNIIGSNSFPLISKKVLTDVNGYNENLPAMQDIDLYLRIAKKANIKYINEPLAIYHVYKGERISRNHEAKMTAYQIFVKKYSEEINKDKELIYSYNVIGLEIYTNSKKTKKAFIYWIKVFSQKPYKIKQNIYWFLKIIAKDIFKI